MRINSILLGILSTIMIVGASCKKDDDGAYEEVLEAEVPEVGESLNKAPSSALPLFPENNAILVSLEPKLEWEAASDPEEKEIAYDILFGTDENDLSLISGDLETTEFQIDTELPKSTSYFWKVVAKDPENETSESGIFTFQTQHVAVSQITENAAFSKRSFATTTVFKDKIWVIGGQDKDGNVLSEVWSSADGINWNLETDDVALGPRKSHAIVVFDDKMCIYNGSDGTYLNNEIWSSTNGVNWVKEENDSTFNRLPFYGQAANTMFVFDGKIWRLAAYDGSMGDLTTERNVWNSEDGKNWTLVKENHGFDHKYGMAVVSFEGKLFGIESLTIEGEEFGKVWESIDGITWTILNDKIPFALGSYSEAVVHKDKLFVTTGSRYQELWFTKDGSTWTKAVENREYPQRYAKSSVVFNNKILIVGGGTYSQSYNDVWVIE